MEEHGTLERLLLHDRRLVIVTLLLVTALAWVYTLLGVGMGMTTFEMTRAPWQEPMSHNMEMNMGMASEMAMDIDTRNTGAGHYIAMLLMWWLMMIAMMLPSATPTILLAAAINRRSSTENPPYGKTAFFVAGYLGAWLFFSVVAVLAQGVMVKNGVLTPMMHSSSTLLTACILIIAGIWQVSPIKQACLRHCRSPVHYLTQHRRPGNLGAFTMGVGHGSYCLGCCWFLMALLFVGGVMNLYWIIGLALFVLLEKLLAHGVWFGKISGVVLIASGLLMAVTQL